MFRPSPKTSLLKDLPVRLISTVLLILALVAYWWDSARAHEATLIRCRQVCAEMGVTIINGALSRDHVHMFVEIPPHVSVSP